jgi:hypothetical protein
MPTTPMSCTVLTRGEEVVDASEHPLVLSMLTKQQQSFRSLKYCQEVHFDCRETGKLLTKIGRQSDDESIPEPSLSVPNNIYTPAKNAV